MKNKETKRVKKQAALFAVGGGGYSLIEILWRGHTHWSMALAGGTCFLLFCDTAKRFQRHSLPVKAVVCAAEVTAVELAFGLVLNRLFKQNVWDYSNQAFHFLGQICPKYTAYWGLLSLAALPLAETLDRKL